MCMYLIHQLVCFGLYKYCNGQTAICYQLMIRWDFWCIQCLSKDIVLSDSRRLVHVEEMKFGLSDAVLNTVNREGTHMCQWLSPATLGPWKEVPQINHFSIPPAVYVTVSPPVMCGHSFHIQLVANNFNRDELYGLVDSSER